MTVTNGYVSNAEFKVAVGGITDTNDDAEIDRAINAASRNIDDFCNRRFWQDSVVAVRYYTATTPSKVWVDDISTSTGLVVKTDPGDDGVFEYTWTKDTDFRLDPINASADAWPWTKLTKLRRGSYVFPSFEGCVQVTAKFGWATTPDAIKEGCLLQSMRYFRRKDAPFGIASGPHGLAELRLMAKLDPDVEELVRPYKREAVALGISR